MKQQEKAKFRMGTPLVRGLTNPEPGKDGSAFEASARGEDSSGADPFTTGDWSLEEIGGRAAFLPGTILGDPSPGLGLGDACEVAYKGREAGFRRGSGRGIGVCRGDGCRAVRTLSRGRVEGGAVLREQGGFPLAHPAMVLSAPTAACRRAWICIRIRSDHHERRDESQAEADQQQNGEKLPHLNT